MIKLLVAEDFDIIREDLCDTLSAQECAEELQGKVEIWLSE